MKSLSSVRNSLLGLAAATTISRLFPGKELAMPSAVVPRRRTIRKRVSRVPRSLSYRTEFAQPLKRTSGITTINLVAGGLNSFLDIQLNQVLTSDLTSTFQVFRIKKVQFDLIPNVDPAGSVAAQATSYHVYTANDTQGLVTAPLPLGVSAYQNYKYGTIVGGEKYRYVFYPKVLNEVNSSTSTATAAGSYASNPWLALSPTGILVPHVRLLYSIVSSSAVTPAMQYTVTIWFDVKRLK